MVAGASWAWARRVGLAGLAACTAEASGCCSNLGVPAEPVTFLGVHSFAFLSS